MPGVIEPYQTKWGHIDMPVRVPRIPPTFTLPDGTRLVKKHPPENIVVTLVCSEVAKCISEQTHHSFTDVQNELFELFNSFTICTHFGKPVYTNEFRVLHWGEHYSLLAMCTVNNLRSLFSKINEHFSVILSVPPTHVELYVQEDILLETTTAFDRVTCTEIWNSDELQKTARIKNEQTEELYQLLNQG